MGVRKVSLRRIERNNSEINEQKTYFCLAVTYFDGLFVQGLCFQQDITKTNASTPEMTFAASSRQCLQS